MKIAELKRIIREIIKEESINEGRLEKKHKHEITTDIQKALDLISRGFYLVDNNTALEHKEGGYIKISKRVTNYFNKLNH